MIGPRAPSAQRSAYQLTVSYSVTLRPESAEGARFAFVGVDSYDYPVPYVLSQLTGCYQKVPDALDTKHVIETKADAEAYLARLTDFAKAMNDETARAKENAALGLIPPDFILDKALASQSFPSPFSAARPSSTDLSHRPSPARSRF